MPKPTVAEQTAAILQARMSWPQAESCARDLEQAGLLRGESTPTEVELARIVADIDRMAHAFDTPRDPGRVAAFVADIKNVIAGRR